MVAVTFVMQYQLMLYFIRFFICSNGGKVGDNSVDVNYTFLSKSTFFISKLSFLSNFFFFLIRMLQVQKTFDLPFEKHHERWIDNRYDWLPNTDNEIPKKLGKSVKSGHLESRGFDEFLKKIYEYLQKFAVGIEQIVWDQEKSNGEFQQQFNLTEVHLRKVSTKFSYQILYFFNLTYHHFVKFYSIQFLIVNRNLYM